MKPVPYLSVFLSIMCSTTFAAVVDGKPMGSQVDASLPDASGVFTTQKDGVLVVKSFGSEGAAYDLDRATADLGELDRLAAKRALSEDERALADALAARVDNLRQFLGSGSLPKAPVQPQPYDQSNIGSATCGVARIGVHAFPALPNWGVAMAQRDIWRAFPAWGGSIYWTLTTTVTLKNGVGTVLMTDAPTPVTIYANDGNRTAAYLNQQQAQNGCRVEAFASVQTNACASPGNYASVSETKSCP